MATTDSIAIKSIVIEPGNRKKIDEVKLGELAASIKERGLLQPIIVQIHPKKQGKYELIAGERRLRAAQKNGCTEIDARVYMNLAEDEVKAIRLTENLQRDDLSPWEEAEHLAGLQELQPTSRVEDLADRVGKSPTWVAQRLAIGKLIPELRELVIAQSWPLSHLPLLARVPADGQVDVLAMIKDEQQEDWDNYWSDRVPTPSGNGFTTKLRAPTLRMLQDRLSELERALKGAKWKLDDASLVPAAGACSTCPKRSSAQALLFPELAGSKDDRCLDAQCWKSKETALVVLQVNKLADKGSKPILLGQRSHSSRNEEDNTDLHEQLGAHGRDAEVEDTYKYDRCKKGEPGAQPAVVVNGEKAGTVEYVKPRSHGSSNGSAKKRSVDQETGKPKPPSKKERLKALADKRKCRAAELWSERLPELLERPQAGVLTGLDIDTINDLVVAFGTHEKLAYRQKANWTAWQDRTGLAATWEALFPVFQDRLKRSGPIENQADGLWDEATEQAEALDKQAELERCYADAVAEIKLPKVLASEGVADPDAEPVQKGA